VRVAFDNRMNVLHCSDTLGYQLTDSLTAARLWVLSQTLWTTLGQVQTVNVAIGRHISLTVPCDSSVTSPRPLFRSIRINFVFKMLMENCWHLCQWVKNILHLNGDCVLVRVVPNNLYKARRKVLTCIFEAVWGSEIFNMQIWSGLR
jgi:hypothetical protein